MDSLNGLLILIIMEDLERRLGYCFKNIEYLKLALTHRSYSAVHNERLEFLGDSILNFSISSILFDRYRFMNEGDLSRLRANLVNQLSLEKIARNLKLPGYLKLGKGEIKSGGKYRSSILSNAVEAIFGAIFEDGGFERTYDVILNQYDSFFKDPTLIHLKKDAKTFLQELLQSKGLSVPQYICIKNYKIGQHAFEVECTISELKIKSIGLGRTLRGAEQAAARIMIKSIPNNSY